MENVLLNRDPKFSKSIAEILGTPSTDMRKSQDELHRNKPKHISNLLKKRTNKGLTLISARNSEVNTYGRKIRVINGIGMQ